jgi:DNA-binding LacI/PurR family transcriptional regulator
MVISGVEAYLRQHNYFFLTVIHRHDSSLLRNHSQLLLERGVEGFITVDTSLEEPLPLPTVSVAGHRALQGVTPTWSLDQERGAQVALEHLLSSGPSQDRIHERPALQFGLGRPMEGRMQSRARPGT